MSVTLVYLITTGINICIIYYFINFFLQKKRWPDWILLSICICYYIISAAFHLNNFDLSSNIIMNLFFGFFMGFAYESTLSKRLLIISFVYILAFSSDIFTIIALGIILRQPFIHIQSQANLVMVGCILSATLFASMIKLAKPRFHELNHNSSLSYWMAMFLIPTSCSFLLHNLVKQHAKNQNYSLRFLGIFAIILISINIFIFYLYSILLKRESVRHENHSLILQNNAYEKQALLIQIFQKDLRIQRHDLNNHLSVLKELAETGESDDLLAYINRLLNDTHTIESGINSGNLVIDAMINSKLYLASHQKTHLYTRISIPDTLEINHTDLTIILGNLLDNALEACSSLPKNKRKIWIEIHSEHSAFWIKIYNPYDVSKIDIRHGRAYTTKDNPSLHGIGLSRIQQIAEKYDGLLEYKTLKIEQEDIFMVNIMLYRNRK